VVKATNPDARHCSLHLDHINSWQCYRLPRGEVQAARPDFNGNLYASLRITRGSDWSRLEIATAPRRAPGPVHGEQTDVTSHRHEARRHPARLSLETELPALWLVRP
jgi:hypothetical protein